MVCTPVPFGVSPSKLQSNCLQTLFVGVCLILTQQILGSILVIVGVIWEMIDLWAHASLQAFKQEEQTRYWEKSSPSFPFDQNLKLLACCSVHKPPYSQNAANLIPHMLQTDAEGTRGKNKLIGKKKQVRRRLLNTVVIKKKGNKNVNKTTHFQMLKCFFRLIEWKKFLSIERC